MASQPLGLAAEDRCEVCPPRGVMGLKLLRRLLVTGILVFISTVKTDTVNTVKADGSYAFTVPPCGIPTRSISVPGRAVLSSEPLRLIQ
jgi:hypothetical protein